jgi:cytochrome b
MSRTPVTEDSRPDPEGLPVWDLPLRLFHWALLALVTFSFVTAQIGGNAMEYHEWSGFAILTLVLFRLLWGFLGGTHARFGDFVRGPRAVIAYAASLRRAAAPRFFAGHNPVGGWMVIALIVCLLVQTGTGLFANDDVMLEGPLAKHVSKQTSDLLSEIHEANFAVLATLIALHVAAALFYLLAKGDNLIRPMFTGRKRPPSGETVLPARGGSLLLAAVVLSACAGVVWLIVGG